MNEEIVKKAMEMLGALASKLGVTTEYLWSVLVKQGKYEAISDLVFCLVVGLIVWRVIKWAPGAFKAFRESDFDKEEGVTVMRAALLVLGVCGTAILAIIALTTLPSIITNFFNPEYFALQKVMEILK